MKIAKDTLLIMLSALILLAAIIFDISAKNGYKNRVKELRVESKEIREVASLQRLWGAKGIKSKLDRVLRVIPNSKRKVVNIKRTKAQLSFVNLTDKELNRLLGKLASLPLRFKTLSVNRVNENFNLECLCVW